MTTKGTAWRHPLRLGEVVLSNGSTLSERDARSKGHAVIDWPQNAMTAVPHPTERHLVVPERGPPLTRYGATEAGFHIGAVGQKATGRSWRAQIMALPEVKGRESAVAELLTTQTEQSMPVENARALLRGLPTERKEAPKQVTANNHDPRAARKAEIAASMQAFNARDGHKTVTRAAPVASVEPAKLKRLAEIRLNALEREGVQPVASGEAKKLRYALDVHAQTAMPLVTVFTQLGVDTSKIIRN